MTFINYIWVSNVLLRMLLAENKYALPDEGYFKTICSLKQIQSEETPTISNIMISFGQLLYMFKDEKVSLNDLCYNGVREFNELQNTKYGPYNYFTWKAIECIIESIQTNFKDYAENQQNKTTTDIILILEDTLCHITYVTS